MKEQNKKKKKEQIELQKEQNIAKSEALGNIIPKAGLPKEIKEEAIKKAAEEKYMIFPLRGKMLRDLPSFHSGRCFAIEERNCDNQVAPVQEFPLFPEKEEKRAPRTIKSCGHIFVGMENFVSRGETIGRYQIRLKNVEHYEIQPFANRWGELTITVTVTSPSIFSKKVPTTAFFPWDENRKELMLDEPAFGDPVEIPESEETKE